MNGVCIRPVSGYFPDPGHQSRQPVLSFRGRRSVDSDTRPVRQQNDQAYTGYFDGPPAWPAISIWLPISSGMPMHTGGHSSDWTSCDPSSAQSMTTVRLNRRGVAFLEIILNDLEMVGDLQFVQVGKDFIIDFLAFFSDADHGGDDQLSPSRRIGPHSSVHGFLARQFMSISTEQDKRIQAIWL